MIGRPTPPVGSEWLRVGVIRLPRISNATDVEALAVEPGVSVRLVTEPSRLSDADLVVIPGTKSTIADLAWLRQTGLAEAIQAHAARGHPIVGICGGYQMLAKTLVDEVESKQGKVNGLGLLDVDIDFTPTKTLANPVGTAFGSPASGYEIHHGRVTRRAPNLPPLITTPGDQEGVLAGPIAATHWHGLLENDEVRRSVLRWAAALAGRNGFTPAPDVSFTTARTTQLDLLADLVAEHLDTTAIRALLHDGPPANLPFVPPGAPVPPPRPAAPVAGTPRDQPLA